jgi:hypothetical protein
LDKKIEKKEVRIHCKKVVLSIRNSISQSGRRRTKLSVLRKINLFSSAWMFGSLRQLLDFFNSVGRKEEENNPERVAPR